MSSGNASLQPTYQGHVATTYDALILFEACLSGMLHHVPRRPHDRERQSLIRSGCIFIYEENASGIKRWTDGVPWSPSRILNNFLVYRELQKPFPPGEKKRAQKRSKRPSKPGEPYPRPGAEEASPPSTYSPTSPASTTTTFKAGEHFDKDVERQLIGSLIDSYGFKEGGLVKKTMSVTVGGVHHHLVSYYKVEDVLTGTLELPSQNERLRQIRPRPELTTRQNFRAPLEGEVEGGEFDPTLDASRNPYGYDGRATFDRRQMSAGQGYRPTAAGYGFDGMHYPDPAQQHAAAGHPPHPGAPGGAYGGLPAPTANATQAYYAAQSPGHAPIKSEEYAPYSSGPYPVTPGMGGVAGAPAASTGDRGTPSMQPLSYAAPIPPGGSTGQENASLVESKSPTADYNRAYYAHARPGSGQSAYPSSDHYTASGPGRSDGVPAYPADKGSGYWSVGGGGGGGVSAAGQSQYPNPPSINNWSQNEQASM